MTTKLKIKLNKATGLPVRVKLNQSPRVSPATYKRLCDWQYLGPGLGLLIDRLATHAVATGFDPVTCTTSTPKKIG